MRLLFAALLAFFSSSVFAGWGNVEIGFDFPNATSACQGAAGPANKLFVELVNQTSTSATCKGTKTDGSGNYYYASVSWVAGCPSGYTEQGTECLPPAEAGTLTQGMWDYEDQPQPLDGENWDGTIVDDAGVVWENVGSSCDPVTGQCISQWEATDQVVDPIDPSTWPPGSIGQDQPGPFPELIDENGMPIAESDPFSNPTGPTPDTGDLVIQDDFSTTTDNTTGTTTETETVTEMSPDGDKVTTNTETITNSDGTSTVSESVTTYDEQSGVTTTTDTVTEYDSQGVGTVTISGNSEEGPIDDNAASGGGDCVQPPICSGDAILCAILFQQWKTRCAEEDIGAADTIPDTNPNDAADTALNDLMTTEGTPAVDSAGVSSELVEGVDLSNIGATLATATGGRSSSCPANRTVSLSFTSKEFSYQPICDLATALNPFIQFLGLFAGSIILLRGLSGG